MKVSLLTSCLLATTFFSAFSVQASEPNTPCSSRCPTGQPVQVRSGAQPVPRPQAQRAPNSLPQPQSGQPNETSNSRGNLDADWDLPNDPASRTKAPPARSEPSPSPAPNAAAAPRSPTPQVPIGLSERLMQAGAARQAVIATIARLSAKQEELTRWDRDAQTKFQRVFGTTDESLRQRVLDRLEVEIANNQKLVAQITDNMALELYIQSKQKK